MASLKTAQDVLLCDECDVNPVQKYCNKCSTGICDGCIVKHISSDTSKAHDIVIYKMRNDDSIVPECQTHSEQRCDMYCKECDIPVCIKCITTGSHKKHDLMEMLEFLNSHKNLILQETKTLEEFIYPALQTTTSDLQTKIADVPRHHEKLMTLISQEGAEWHREIDVIINRRKKEAEDMRKSNLIHLHNLLSDAKNLQTAVHQTILDNRNLLKLNNTKAMKNYKSKLPQFQNLPATYDVVPTTFTPLPIQRKQVDKMFGTLKPSTVSPHGQIKISPVTPPQSGQEILDSPTNLSTADAGYLRLYNIACLRPDEVWVSGSDKKIKQINMTGSVQKKITVKNNEPGSITVTLEGDLIYTDWRDRSVNIIRDGEVKKIISLEDWLPVRVCSTATGDILVALHKGDTPTKVVRYTGSTEKQVTQFDESGKPWFSIGWGTFFIDVNRNEDLCASDNQAKQVVVITQAGKLRFRYSGNLSSKKYKSFDPRGIATDGKCQIIVADDGNHCIHVIDRYGHFLCYIDTCKLYRPYDICVDSNNALYVAEIESVKVKKIQYMK